MNRRLAPRRGIHTDTDAGTMRSHVLRDINALSEESLSGFMPSIPQPEEKTTSPRKFSFDNADQYMDEIQHHVNELEACCKSDVSVNGLIVHLQLPRMVLLLLQKEARGGGVAATSYCFVSSGHEAVDGARLAAFRSPPPPLRAPTYKLQSEINVSRSRRLCQPP